MERVTVGLWYQVMGEGEPVVLLHGALVDSRVFDGNLVALAQNFRLYRPELRGHGHTADVAGPLSPSVMAKDVIAFLETVVQRRAHLVGYSAGAVVAMMVAGQRPDLIDRLVLVSGAFHRDGWLLPPASPADIPKELYDAYGEVSPHGVHHFPVIIDKIAASSADEPALTAADLAAITCRTLVMAGDDDVASLEHLLDLYRALPVAELAIVPGASHCLIMEKPELCTGLVADFLMTEPVTTFMPLRRS
ncbi:oxidoreductase [Rhizocola hellebori]|uniref:Oxidoreductase n=1 Tax=Rhizocola hellebori TaxID=1392758 RepID=A0A8J3VL38_9ACTN|nr:alpha/beta hydrolase [Rhizocola hellebori]GIH11109.1 oxidoreductase [Rhizocola hellebori]